jgi:hypothetical protein
MDFKSTYYNPHPLVSSGDRIEVGYLVDDGKVLWKHDIIESSWWERSELIMFRSLFIVLEDNQTTTYFYQTKNG